MKVRRWFCFSLAALVLAGSLGSIEKSLAIVNAISGITQSATSQEQPTTIAQMMESAKPVVVSSGSFRSGEHPTQGTARILRQNGKLFLELNQGFNTSRSGPDLVVVLHRSGNVIGSTKPPAYPLKTGDYVILAPLQKFSGAQRYLIPANINVANYKSAVIWCRKFNATFGAASLGGM
ncbi:MAG: DM13 domain-containing protein [Stenomitos rutilans HA7619-LM2]|jgi:hypothetical protein|nr:DM13 domain-containing protein [Stenomitos rutilans HA7619-LM2]